MKLTISQVNNEYASPAVYVYVAGRELGQIGAGESVSTETDMAPCPVRAVCGSYSANMVVGGDADLVVSWTLRPPGMELSRRS